MRLSEVAQGKDNNFNLIRFLAAFAVLISHSFALATGSGNAEPLYTTYGLTWGDIAVDVFFVTSGFLVTASLLSRRSAVSFAWARVLRIFPALLVMLILTVFVMGLALTTYTPHEYLTAYLTWKYLLQNAVLLRGIEFHLPGVFASDPLKSVVNGSLWSLQPEIEMYMLLLGLWVLAVLARRQVLLKWVVVAIAAISCVLYLAHGIFSDPGREFPRLAFMFFAGGSFYVLRDRISLQGWLFASLLALTLLSAVSRVAFFFALSVSLPYLLMYSAYALGGPIRAFNRCGDYSYGIYIYAFPVQQAIADLVPGISTATLMILSAVTTLALAMLSWHLIEKRALALKSYPQRIIGRREGTAAAVAS